jgi:hypothetical protein
MSYQVGRIVTVPTLYLRVTSGSDSWTLARPLSGLLGQKARILLSSPGAQPMSRTSMNPDQKPSMTLPGTVEKIIKSPDPHVPEKAQIGIEGAEHLYREIRIDNVLKDQDGEKVALKQGAEVEVTIEADKEDTVKKKD